MREGQLGLSKGNSSPVSQGQVTLGEGEPGAQLLCLGQGPTLLSRDSRAQRDTRCCPLKMAVGKENEQQQDSGRLQAPGAIYLALACPACARMLAEVALALRAPHSPIGLVGGPHTWRCDHSDGEARLRCTEAASAWGPEAGVSFHKLLKWE